jgi:hypothetical protein
MRDNIHNEVYRVAIPPVVVADNTAQVGAWIDRSGYQSLSFAILTGTLADADATFAVLMEEADAADQSDAAAVADQDMLSQTVGVAPEAAAGFTFAADNATRKIGYIGSKKYARITVTPSGNSGNAPLAVAAKLANGSIRPV